MGNIQCGSVERNEIIAMMEKSGLSAKDNSQKIVDEYLLLKEAIKFKNKHVKILHLSNIDTARNNYFQEEDHKTKQMD
jgi:hypothetical protein